MTTPQSYVGIGAFLIVGWTILLYTYCNVLFSPKRKGKAKRRCNKHLITITQGKIALIDNINCDICKREKERHG